jgi:hypothetical protein
MKEVKMRRENSSELHRFMFRSFFIASIAALVTVIARALRVLVCVINESEHTNELREVVVVCRAMISIRQKINSTNISHRESIVVSESKSKQHRGERTRRCENFRSALRTPAHFCCDNGKWCNTVVVVGK